MTPMGTYVRVRPLQAVGVERTNGYRVGVPATVFQGGGQHPRIGELKLRASRATLRDP